MKEADSHDRVYSDHNYEEAEQEFRSAARAEAEASGREAAQLAMRGRFLADVAFEAMSRGDVVAVTVGARTSRVVLATRVAIS